MTDAEFLDLLRRVETLYKGRRYPTVHWYGVGTGQAGLLVDCGGVLGRCREYGRLTAETMPALELAVADCVAADPETGADHAVALWACRLAGKPPHPETCLPLLSGAVRPLFAAAGAN